MGSQRVGHDSVTSLHIYIYAVGIILVWCFELVKATPVRDYLIKQNEKELNHSTK